MDGNESEELPFTQEDKRSVSDGGREADGKTREECSYGSVTVSADLASADPQRHRPSAPPLVPEEEERRGDAAVHPLTAPASVAFRYRRKPHQGVSSSSKEV